MNQTSPPTDDLVVLGTACQEVSEPGFRVRVALPSKALHAYRITVRLMPLFAPGRSRQFRSAGNLDKLRILSAARKRLMRELQAADSAMSTVLVQRYVGLGPTLGLEKATLNNRRLVYDVDDAIWLTGRQTGGHPLGVLKGTARKVRWLAERAEHVMAGNEILAEHLAAYAERVTVVPSLVDPPSYRLHEHRQDATVTLGWVGSATTATYLRRIVPALEQFARSSTQAVRLLVVGGRAPSIRGVRVEERSWSPASEREALAETDIGLMPLDDTPWSRGKCAYKSLQYMASGIPPVVDDVGISAKVVSGAGCVASSPDDWLEGLIALAGDAALRARLGETGRRRVEEEFSLQRWAPTIASILRGD